MAYVLAVIFFSIVINVTKFFELTVTKKNSSSADPVSSAVFVLVQNIPFWKAFDKLNKAMIIFLLNHGENGDQMRHKPFLTLEILTKNISLLCIF